MMHTYIRTTALRGEVGMIASLWLASMVLEQLAPGLKLMPTEAPCQASR